MSCSDVLQLSCSLVCMRTFKNASLYSDFHLQTPVATHQHCTHRVLRPPTVQARIWQQEQTKTLLHREEARSMQSLADAITSHPAWPERSASMAQSLPRSPSGRTRTATIVTGGTLPRFRHPVWNFGSATNMHRVALLKVLLSAEAERLQVGCMLAIR